MFIFQCCLHLDSFSASTIWASCPISPSLPLTPNLLHPLLYAWLLVPPLNFGASRCLYLSSLFMHIYNVSLWRHKRFYGYLISGGLKNTGKNCLDMMTNQVLWYTLNNSLVVSHTRKYMHYLLYRLSSWVNQLIQNIIYNNTVLIRKETYRNIQYIQ